MTTRNEVKQALMGLVLRASSTVNVAAEINAVEKAVDDLVRTEVTRTVDAMQQVGRKERVERVAGQILAARFAAAGHGGLWGEEDVKVAFHAADMLIDYIDKNERRG